MRGALTPWASCNKATARKTTPHLLHPAGKQFPQLHLIFPGDFDP